MPLDNHIVRARDDATGAVGPTVWGSVTDPREIEADWRALESEGVTTPFQSFAWVSAWTSARASGDAALVVTLRRGDRLDAVLPFEIRRCGPLRIAHWSSGRHAGYNFGLWRRDAVPSAADLAAALGRIGRSQGIDLFVLETMPAVWEGMANPLAAAVRTRAALDDGHGFRLAPTFEALLADRNAKHKRKKIRSKEKILAAAGGYRIATAADDTEARASLAAFFTQKAVSLGRLGVRDPFADARVRAFYEALATGPAPLLELTRLEAGGVVRAVLGSIVRGRTSHQLFVSTAADDMARASPGETLFYRHIEAACERGLEAYDMGMGSERYKASWCNETVTLVSAELPVSTLGRVVGRALDLSGRIKAALRRNERLWARVRAVRARFAGHAPRTDD